MTNPILELRVAITTADYDRLVAFYEQVIGLSPTAIWTTDTTRAQLYELGRGTLEIFDEGQAEMVDQIEVGRRVSGQFRFALQVPDLDAALERARAMGATIVHEPVITPWNDRNARLVSPDGLQITLFQTLGNE